jgi:ribosomal protein S18 acetylase RimI-like enzyme
MDKKELKKMKLLGILEMVKIRKFRQTDKDSVITIWKDVFNPQKPHNDPELVINMKTKHNDGLFFIAEENKQLIGTIMGGFDGHRGWLYSLAVSPKYRRKGVGTLLVNKVLNELINLGCIKVNLQIYSDNRSTVEFYKKIGFLIEDRISMGKKIKK